MLKTTKIIQLTTKPVSLFFKVATPLHKNVIIDFNLNSMIMQSQTIQTYDESVKLIYVAQTLGNAKNKQLTSTDKTDKIYQSYCKMRYEKVSEKQAVQSEGER